MKALLYIPLFLVFIISNLFACDEGLFAFDEEIEGSTHTDSIQKKSKEEWVHIPEGVDKKKVILALYEAAKKEFTDYAEGNHSNGSPKNDEKPLLFFAYQQISHTDISKILTEFEQNNWKHTELQTLGFIPLHLFFDGDKINVYQFNKHYEKKGFAQGILDPFLKTINLSE